VSLRLFVALVPPDPVRRRLAEAQAALRRAGGDGDAVRWVEPANVHLTLQFLGAVPEDRLDGVREAVAAAAAGARPLQLEVSGAGAFPGPRRPRVIWSGLGGDLASLQELVASLGRRLAPLGFPPGDRPFRPHLTHGRVREGRPPPRLGEALAAASAVPAVPWRADEVVLIRSHLSPRGSRHEPLARFPLSAP
jgi:2'-5' RNA ligase